MTNSNQSHPYEGQTDEQIQARRHYWIEKGDICNANTCEGPVQDKHGNCENCGYPITQATRDSWKDFEPVITDTSFKEVLDNLFTTPLIP
jgi:hypothetical protein